MFVGNKKSPAKPLGKRCARKQGYGLCISISDKHKKPFPDHRESFSQKPVYCYSFCYYINPPSVLNHQNKKSKEPLTAKNKIPRRVIHREEYDE